MPSLHKLYSLATILHLNSLEISGRYDAPFLQVFHDGAAFPPPRTHLTDSPLPEPEPAGPDPFFESNSTQFLNRLPAPIGPFPGVEDIPSGGRRYGYVGPSDRRMVPLLRPGSVVMIDTSIWRVEDTGWFKKYDRPIYFVEIRTGYRCAWFQKDKTRLIMQPHTLSHCSPEAWRTPEEAEVVGQEVGIVTYLNEPLFCRPATIPAMRPDWN